MDIRDARTVNLLKIENNLDAKIRNPSACWPPTTKGTIDIMNTPKSLGLFRPVVKTLKRLSQNFKFEHFEIEFSIFLML